MEWLSTLAENPFYEFTFILLFAAILGAVGQFLKQPLIVVFIALGIIVGPSLLDIVKSKENIELLAHIGIAILLFIVGLKLDLRIIKSVGRIALMTGLGQVLFTSLIGYFIGISLGFSSLHNFYIALALTFSSTIIIVKLLSDKKEIDSLHGQIAVGFLIVQDIVVIIVMIVLATMGDSEEGTIINQIVRTVASGVGLLLLTFLMMKLIIPRLSHFIAKSQELLSLFAIAWCIAMTSLSEYIGFSGEVGAFLAGISLASSDFKEAISSRLVSLRDFLLLFFFVSLGSNLNLSLIGEQVPSAIIFSVFVLVGNPIIVLIIMGAMGYRKRTALLAGFTVAQISEFSLIFAGMGLAIGHITDEVVGLITLVGLITIGLSTYLILYSHQIYNLLAPALSIFQRKNPYRESGIDLEQKQKVGVIIFGVGRFGGKVVEMLDLHPELDYVGVDLDPDVVKNYQKKGKQMVYGDIEDPDILEHIPYKDAKCIISTVPNKEYSLHLIRKLRKGGFNGRIYLTARDEELEAELNACELCNDFEVLMPYQMAASNFYNDFLKSIC
ncbi:cation:proton antiporter [Perlabentimonas gracilis]|uniref:cation:proton antiporter n=1 Tax=Perlabentimonas gracilis TaxID=2715279 RepID=UPI00140DBA80|nr:cation:proton antiporter [Perlabentimonas gracilis]NHB68893.1 cation:proton antiporter [Perlabentimonas gracilis]